MRSTAAARCLTVLMLSALQTVSAAAAPVADISSEQAATAAVREHLDELATCWQQNGQPSAPSDWRERHGKRYRTLVRTDRSSLSLKTSATSNPIATRHKTVLVTTSFRSEAFQDNVALFFDVTGSANDRVGLTVGLLQANRPVVTIVVPARKAHNIAKRDWLAGQFRKAIAATPLPNEFALLTSSVCAPPESSEWRKPSTVRNCEQLTSTPAQRKQVVTEEKAAIASEQQFVDDNGATIDQLITRLFPVSDRRCVEWLTNSPSR